MLQCLHLMSTKAHLLGVPASIRFQQWQPTGPFCWNCTYLICQKTLWFLSLDSPRRTWALPSRASRWSCMLLIRVLLVWAAWLLLFTAALPLRWHWCVICRHLHGCSESGRAVACVFLFFCFSFGWLAKRMTLGLLPLLLETDFPRRSYKTPVFGGRLRPATRTTHYSCRMRWPKRSHAGPSSILLTFVFWLVAPILNISNSVRVPWVTWYLFWLGFPIVRCRRLRLCHLLLLVA